MQGKLTCEGLEEADKEYVKDVLIRKRLVKSTNTRENRLGEQQDANKTCKRIYKEVIIQL